jgi:hypothetical protein
VRLQAAIKYDAKALPAPVADFLACFRGASQFLGKVPENSLVAVAGRFDVDRFITWARKYGPQEKSEERAKEKDANEAVVIPLLRLLGPDLGIYLRPDAADEEHWLQWAGAMSVRPQMPREREAQQLVRAAVPSLLAGVAKMFSESASSRVAGLLTGDGLRMVEDSLRISRSAIPAITLADGQLWVAGTEKALAEARALAESQTTAKDITPSGKSPRWSSHLSDLLQGPSHLLYLDCAAWGRLLSQRADALVTTAVRQRGVDEATARRGLQQLLSLLRLADTLVAAVKIDDGQIAASLSLAVEPPSSAVSATSSPSSSRPGERP